MGEYAMTSKEAYQALNNSAWSFWKRERYAFSGNLRVYTGGWLSRHHIGGISVYQAMAFLRHNPTKKEYMCVRMAEHRWQDVYMIGDLDAFLNGCLKDNGE